MGVLDDMALLWDTIFEVMFWIMSLGVAAVCVEGEALDG